MRFGRHFLAARENALRQWRALGNFQFDELETFEHHRILKPLTVGLLVSGRSGMLVETAVGRMRSRAGASEESHRRREDFERREGRRPHESRAVVRSCLRRLGSGGEWLLVTDKKASYAREMAGRGPHRAVSGWGSKGKKSPLFGVNHMAAKLRYGLSRLIRRSWCVSKRRGRLALHLAIYWGWHNGWRWRTNKVKKTPGMEEGLWGRRLTPGELLGWRQDWGVLSRRLDAA